MNIDEMKERAGKTVALIVGWRAAKAGSIIEGECGWAICENSQALAADVLTLIAEVERIQGDAAQRREVANVLQLARDHRDVCAERDALKAEVERLTTVASAAQKWRRDKSVNVKLNRARGSRVEIDLANALESSGFDRCA